MSKLKIEELKEILIKFDVLISEYDVFLETGTYEGETICEMENYFNKLYTIEIDETLYEDVKNKYNHSNNIKFIKGDSAKILKDILLEIEKNTIFWLDGHWSGGKTNKGLYDCPLLLECEQINKYYTESESLIIIDDYRLFGTNIHENWSDITHNKIINIFKGFEVIDKVINDRLILKINRK